MRGARTLAFACALAAAARGSAAPLGDSLDRAQIHFRAGESLYNLGDYREAIREFEAGFALAPLPGFLLNLGQSYRALGNTSKAIEMFEKYEKATHTSDAAVEQILADLRAAEHAAPRPTAAKAPATARAPSSGATERSFARRHWWIFPVVGVVLAAALATGLYLALNPPNRYTCNPSVAALCLTVGGGP
jgi:tetratricopeptide (TPR) repeat protein